MKTKILQLIFILFGIQVSAQVNLRLSLVSKAFSNVIDIANAGDNRLFIAEQIGRIQILNRNGIVNQTPFLNIQSKVRNSGEQGLLGLAFHPSYAQNGYFFVNYINNDQNTVVARYQVSPTDSSLADPLSETILLTITQPYSNHNGGDLNFGPDGYLYISSGDGGSGGDPQDYGQNKSTLLGKILRIDVNNPTLGLNYGIPPTNPFADGPGSNKDEIWSLGLRNPWRFSFDRLTGDMWIGDVGQNAFEEIDFEPAGSAGGINYGWRCYEGNHIYNSDNCAAESSYTFPVYEYGREMGCSVTGGYVYRGTDYSLLYGLYLYVDFCSGKLWSLKKVGQDWVNEKVYENASKNFITMGEDNRGELYLGTLNGELYRVCETSWPTNYPNLTINENPIPVGSYQAGNMLNSGGKVASSTYVNFFAFGSILLEPGFKAENGAVFSANTSVCLHGGY